MSETGNVNFEGNQKYFLSPQLLEKMNAQGKSLDSQAVTNPQLSQNAAKPAQVQSFAKDAVPLRDAFVREKQNDGLLGKFYNFLKNVTGLGLGSDKIFKSIDKYEKGEISKEEIEKKINKYKISRENAVQNMGDLVVGSLSIWGFFKSLNLAKYGSAIAKVNEKNVKDIPFGKFLLKGVSAKPVAAALIPVFAIAGGLTKYLLCKVERITSKEFDADKTLPNKERKAQQKKLKRQKRAASWKNFWTGSAAGVLAPITAVAGGIVGVPIYLASTLGLRYATNRHDEEDASFGKFGKFLKDNALLNTLSAVALGAFAFRKANFSKVYTQNLDKAVAKLKDVVSQPLEGIFDRTSVDDIQERLFNSEAITKILTSDKPPLTKVQQLIDENIFAAKFLQIYENAAVNNGGREILGRCSELADILKQDCPATRTLEQAQSAINKLWGSAEYTVKKLVGVGTVAESYIAQDKSGKEVCIKILKEGINAQKIDADKQKIINILTGGKALEKCDEQTKYLVRCMEDLASAIKRETDLTLESKAATEIQRFCKNADVVRPIGAKEGIYVMEKAPGISVKTLQEYINNKVMLKYYEKQVEQGVTIFQDESDIRFARRRIIEINAEIDKIKLRSPDFQDFDISSEQIKTLLYKYMDILNEQFVALSRGGKTIHGDLHTGNVFVNLEALKTGKGKLFTLIDTGNFIQMTKEQTKQAMRLKAFIDNGNVKALTSIILDGAILPDDLTKEKAFELVLNDLQTIFFDTKTKCPMLNCIEFNELAEKILRKHQIVSNNAQLNFAKAKNSADKSFRALGESLLDQKGSEVEGVVGALSCAGGLLKAFATYKRKGKWQDTKNIFVGGFIDYFKHMFDRNNKPRNSEDFLTYKLKQWQHKEAA